MFNFYTAGKIWYAPNFKFLRDNLQMPVKARWIDAKSDSDLVMNRKNDLWQMCYEDVRDSDYVLLYSGDSEDEQRGALVEVGMAFGMGKRVYAINRCKSLTVSGTSDVAFTHHHLWNWLDTDNLVKGACYAQAMEQGYQMKKVA